MASTPQAATQQSQAAPPLCVDLDGTLIRTDVLWESLVRLLARNPLYLVAVVVWWMRGRAHLKAELARRVQLDVAALPYQPEFLQWLRQQKAAGRELYLVTASDVRLAGAVADHLGLFTEVLASDGRHNLRGKAKGARLAERFGDAGFDYAGNSSVDLPVWERGRRAIVVNASERLARRAAKRATVENVFPARESGLGAFWRGLRPYQWVKNLIVLVPAITSHRLTEPAVALDALIAFVAFCLCASGVYLLNDLLDVESDRHHAAKRERPFARGDLPLAVGLVAFPLLLLGSLLIGTSLSQGFVATLGVYVLLTTAYSLRLKQAPLLDVFCLAGLYTVRLVAGHEATGIVYSFWLLVFSMFLFLSLALVKRGVELEAARQQNRNDIKGRGYAAGDLPLITILGCCSAFLAVLVLALYVNSQEVRILYRHPTLLLLICPLLLYWMSRLWLLAARGRMHDDPVVFALRDPVSYAVGALTLAVIWLATGA